MPSKKQEVLEGHLSRKKKGIHSTTQRAKNPATIAAIAATPPFTTKEPADDVELDWEAALPAAVGDPRARVAGGVPLLSVVSVPCPNGRGTAVALGPVALRPAAEHPMDWTA